MKDKISKIGKQTIKLEHKTNTVSIDFEDVPELSSVFMFNSSDDALKGYWTCCTTAEKQNAADQSSLKD